MNRSFAITCLKQSATGTVAAISQRLMISGAMVFLTVGSAIAQNRELQEKVAVVKQSAAENKQKLQQYQWIETTQLTLKGDPKPTSQNLCRYGPDGQVQKNLVSPPPEPPSGGRMKQKIIAKKKEEMKDYLGEVKGLLGMYVPPDLKKMEQARQNGNLTINPTPGTVTLTFVNYAQPGDRMSLTFDTTARKITSLSVDSYMSETKDGVTLQVHMASLPDGTNYAQQTILSATAKKLQVTTTNSNYQKLGGSY